MKRLIVAVLTTVIAQPAMALQCTQNCGTIPLAGSAPTPIPELDGSGALMALGFVVVLLAVISEWKRKR